MMPIGRQFSTGLSHFCMLCEQHSDCSLVQTAFSEVAVNPWEMGIMSPSGAKIWAPSTQGCSPVTLTGCAVVIQPTSWGFLAHHTLSGTQETGTKRRILKSSYQQPWNYGSLIYWFKIKFQNLRIHKSNHVEESEVSQILFFLLIVFQNINGYLLWTLERITLWCPSAIQSLGY